MKRAGNTKVLVVALVWLLLLAAGAVAYRLLIVPHRQAEAAAQARAAAEAEQRAKAQRIDQTGSTPTARASLTIALDSFSGYALFRSQEFRDALRVKGLSLALKDDGANYAARLASLRSGETPLAVFTIDALLKASATVDDLPGTIVLVLDETTGADAMIAYREGVANLDALNRADAQIVLTPDSPSETLARVVTARFNLPQLPREPFVRAQDALDVLRQFQQTSPQQPRAFVLWEPYVSKALENPQAHVLLDSSRFRGYIVDVLVVERGFLLQNEPLVRQLVEAYLTTRYAIQERDGGFTRLMLEDAKGLGQPITDEQAARLVAGVWWKNTLENYGHFGLLDAAQRGALQPLDEMIESITEVLSKTGGLPRDPTGGSPHKLYYRRLLDGLRQDGFHPGQTPQDESIRGAAALRPLTDEEWKKLVPVAEAAVQPLTFARGTHVLTEASQTELAHLAENLQTLPNFYLLVRGHARGNARSPEETEANRQLAEARAQAAARFLLDAGIDVHRLRAIGMPPTEDDGSAQSVTFLLGSLPY